MIKILRAFVDGRYLLISINNYWLHAFKNLLYKSTLILLCVAVSYFFIIDIESDIMRS